jgi:hypothetical protein
MEDLSNNMIDSENMSQPQDVPNAPPMRGRSSMISSMGGSMGILVAMINNPIYADIKDNKITKLYNINDNLKISDTDMTKIQDNLDADGFLKLNININNLFNIYKEILKNNDLLNTKFNTDITSGKIIFDFCSTFGLFILTKESDENFNKNIFTVLTPRSLFTPNYAKHINIIFDGIIIPKLITLISVKSQQDVMIGKVDMVREFLLKFFQQFNKSSDNNEIKFANMMNFLVNLIILFFVIIMLTSSGIPIGNVFAEAINMFSILLSQFPNDACYFENNVLMFEPNICAKKKIIQDTEKGYPKNYMMVLAGSLCITVIIIIILIIKISTTKSRRT